MNMPISMKTAWQPIRKAPVVCRDFATLAVTSADAIETFRARYCHRSWVMIASRRSAPMDFLDAFEAYP